MTLETCGAAQRPLYFDQVKGVGNPWPSGPLPTSTTAVYVSAYPSVQAMDKVCSKLEEDSKTS